MTNRNFEDIDKLFREGLNSAEEPITFSESDWSKLKERLDKNGKKKRGVIWISRLSGIAAIILLFLVIRMLLPGDQKNIIQQAEVQRQDMTIKQEQNQLKVTQQAKNLEKKVEKVSNTLLAQNKHSEKKLPKKNNVEKLSASKENTAKDTIQVENLSAPVATIAETVKTKNQDTPKPDNESPYNQEKIAVEESLFAANEKPNVVPEPEHLPYKLALSILAAPAFNGVNNMSNATVGNDFGLMVTLGVAKNWSFSTGAIYGVKLYETGFSNYNPIKDIWTEYYPKSVNADCRVLDIPLNVDYKFLSRRNTTISAGTGISSYIMLREDYSFTYVEQDDDTALAYHLVNENQHWLSVLNLQATVQQRINSKLSIGIQPYMKIPLSNIGFAGVKLQSVGMAVILNWNLN